LGKAKWLAFGKCVSGVKGNFLGYGGVIMKGLILFSMLLFLLVPCVISQAIEIKGMVMFLPFDEGSGDKVKDLSGNGNDGTINKATWVKAGKIGSALLFSGNGYVEVAHSKSLSLTDAITIMAWTNLTAGGSGEQAVVSKGQWAVNDLPYEFTETPGGVIFWQMYNDAGRDGCQPSTPVPGEWHHVAGTFDGKVFKGYVDGKLGKEWGYVGKMPENTASVTVGMRSKSKDCFFNGMIDEVAIFNRALSEDEIKSAMNGITTAVEQEGKLTTSWGNLKK
jgi:hypothetical protein